MAASTKQKAINVTLSPGTEDERDIELRLPGPTEHFRMMAAQIALVKLGRDEPITEADEGHIRRAIELLAVTPDGVGLDEDDMLRIEAPDWARLFTGLMLALTEANKEAAPLAKRSSSKSSTSSSPTSPAKATASPSGAVS